jgi:hypothetical protein
MRENRQSTDFGRCGTGETNFHPYDVEMDETFGAALATLDKSLHAVTIEIQRLYFHQGTINQGTHLYHLRSPNPSPSPILGNVLANLGKTFATGENLTRVFS